MFGFLPRPREILHACLICTLICSLMQMTPHAPNVGHICTVCFCRYSQAHFLNLNFLRDYCVQWPTCIGALAGPETFQVSWQKRGLFINKSIHMYSQREWRMSRRKACIVICSLITASESLPSDRLSFRKGNFHLSFFIFIRKGESRPSLHFLPTVSANFFSLFFSSRGNFS